MIGKHPSIGNIRNILRVRMIRRFMVVGIFVIALLFLAPASCQSGAGIDFSGDPTSGYAPLTVRFTDMSSLPVVEDFRRWDFGDGTVVTDPVGVIEHTFLEDGTFSVRMDRVDAEGYHSLIKYSYITVMTVTPTPTVTTVPTTSPVTTVTTQTPTTIPTTSPTGTPTTLPYTSPTTFPPTTTPTTQPTVPVPAEFYGHATSSAQPVSPGSQISAWIATRKAGEIQVITPGLFGGPGAFDPRLRVYATNDEIASGPVLVTFWLNGTYRADQTAIFQSGNAQNITLTFPIATPTPTTPPVTTPVTTSPTTSPTTGPTTAPTITSTTTVTTTPITPPTTTAPTTGPTPPTPTPTGTPGFMLTCEPGWNHLSIPRYLTPGADTGAIFSVVDTGGRSIWRYNASIQAYDRVYPTTRLFPTDSVWVYSTSHTVVPLYFAMQQGVVERNLFTGWNGFGIPNTSSVAARDALSPVSSAWGYAYGYDALQQQYEVSIVNGGTGVHSDSRILNPGSGYWLHMGMNTTFRVNLF